METKLPVTTQNDSSSAINEPPTQKVDPTATKTEAQRMAQIQLIDLKKRIYDQAGIVVRQP